MRRLSTGIKGLDSLIMGGFPENTANLVSGPAGSGKSILSMHFLNFGSQQGEKGIYVSLEESRDEIKRSMSSFNLLDENNGMRIVDLGELRRGQHIDRRKKMVAFDALGDIVSRLVEDTGATRLVIDSLSAAGLPYRSSEELREDLFSFVRDMKDTGVTTVLISESIEGGTLTRYNIEQFVADTFIVLGLESVKGDLRRTITVRKMRFTHHDTAKHPFLIQKNGIVVASDEKVF